MSSSRVVSGRLAIFPILFSIFAVACGGEMPSGDGGPDAPTGGACAGLDDGDDCGDGNICVGGSCVAPRCGDNVVSGAESCDDGNDTAFDGCNPDCTLTCSSDEDCDDGNPCNGPAVCEETNVCAPNLLSPPGADCMMASGEDGVCSADTVPTCIAPGCGNGVTDGSEQCDDGADGDDADGCKDTCEFSCLSDDDCTDNSVCTGIESCDGATHACTTTGMLTCTASDACHTPSCDDTAGCEEALIDADEDGHAPLALGACGDDCDDTNETVYVGAEEICDDGLDNNCNGSQNEVAPTWYIDCDDDGYAANTDSMMTQCSEPGSPGCAGGWTLRRPVVGDLSTIDCNDALAARHPGAMEIVGNGADEDCNGGELCYVDGDGDGARRSDGSTVPSADLACSATALEAGASALIDCNDSSGAIRPGATEVVADGIDQNCDGGESCYANADNDSFRTGSIAASSDSDCTDSGEALASQASGDCCDNDARAYPGTTVYYGTATNCGGFDFNCDGSTTDRYTVPGGCFGGGCINRAGYACGIPTCGNSGEWIAVWGCFRDCDEFGCFCDSGSFCGDGSATQQTQQCR